MKRKTAVITGGSSGIGLEIIKRYHKTGIWNTVSISRNITKIEQAKLELKDCTEKCDFYIGDVSDEYSLRDVCGKIKQKYGCIDVLVNSAGVIYPGGIENLSIEEWKKSLDINITGAFLAVQMFLELLKESQYSSIINISSISAKTGGSSIAYSVAKAGMDMFTKALAKELAKYKIRVNSVNPGIVNSGFQVSNGIIERDKYEEFLANISKSYPLGIGQPEDIANMVFFLSSEEAKWITGSIFCVDGGRSVNI